MATATAERVRDTRTPFQRLADGNTMVPGTILHTDPTRGLTYLWHDQSQDMKDKAPRESGVETSSITVLNTHGECVAYLRISFSNEEVINATFSRLLEWAEENEGWSLGFRAAKRGYGPVPTPAKVWARAHQHADATPASHADADRYIAPYNLTEQDAPADPAVLEADLVALEDTLLRPRLNAWISSLGVPFVAYSNTQSHVRGTGVGRRMYISAARHLATTGRVLRASGIQSAWAEALWDRLVADPTVPTGSTPVTNRFSDETEVHLTLDYRL